MVVNEGACAPPHKCDLTRWVARCPAIENEQLVVFAEVQLLLATDINLVGLRASSGQLEAGQGPALQKRYHVQ